MAVLAPLSKQDISNALASSYVGRPGFEKLDPTRFGEIFGRLVVRQYDGIRLVGEIEQKEGEETYKELQKCLKLVLSGSSLWSICRQGSKAWRAILSLYFVYTGIFLYGEDWGHDLWPHIFRGLSMETDGNLAKCCGELFIQCLKENKLEEFSNIATGHHFSNRILLHGLIPRKHMDRFVSDLILPELSNHSSNYATGASLVEKWKNITSFRYLPKPIQRFVEHGEPVNFYLVERFLEILGDEGSNFCCLQIIGVIVSRRESVGSQHDPSFDFLTKTFRSSTAVHVYHPVKRFSPVTVFHSVVADKIR